ncbi:hypothetical protein D3C87_126290 [compost metagenome]
MIKKIKTLSVFVLFSAMLFSCSDDDSSSNPNPGNTLGSKYALSFSTTDFDQYIWQFDSTDQLMTGTIDMVGKGIEQSGACIPVGNTFFALTSDDEGSASFYLNSNSLLTLDNRVSIPESFAYGVTDDDKVVIVAASWDGSSTNNELIIYDPATVSISNRKFDNYGLEGGLFEWPTSVAVSGNRVFVSTFIRDAAWNLSQATAQVKVYEYPSLKYLYTIEDTRTTAIGQYYTNTGMIQTESGDVYTFSSNSRMAGYTPTESPSGILRIKNGQSTFDSSYFMNISTALNGKVLSAYPAGGEKAYIIYMPNDADATEAGWGFLNHKSFKFKSAIIDLSNQTIVKVTGLPDHAGDNYYGLGSLYVENGKGYKSFVTNTEAKIYQIDLTTGVAKPGANISGGLDIPAITKLSPRK